MHNLANKRNRGLRIPARVFFLDPRGTTRKTSGSYYTNPGMVNALIASALVPVLEQKLKLAGLNKDLQEKALLSLKVCDPACGSGAFLIAATEYLGERLARIRTQSDYPSDEEIRHARRDVLRHCIYGVDINPMAVELAKVSLWLIASTGDQPLNFLDHKIKCGNSLIGTTPELILKNIPIDAYTAVEDDDRGLANQRKTFAREYYRMEQRHRGQKKLGLIDEESGFKKIKADDLSEIFDENSPVEIRELEETYRKSREEEIFLKNKLIADYWTSAFFWRHDTKSDEYPRPDGLMYLMENEEIEISTSLKDRINECTREYQFFHWHLEFPEVFENGGFDCVLGNPPWDKVKPDKRQFFGTYHSKISAFNASERKRVRQELLRNIQINNAFKKYNSQFERFSKYFKYSSMYRHQYCKVDGKKQSGDNNSYMLFLERCFHVIRKNGMVSLILPNGFIGDLGSGGLRKLLLNNGTLKVWKIRNKCKDDYFFPSVASQAIIILLS